MKRRADTKQSPLRSLSPSPLPNNQGRVGSHAGGSRSSSSTSDAWNSTHDNAGSKPDIRRYFRPSPSPSSRADKENIEPRSPLDQSPNHGSARASSTITTAVRGAGAKTPINKGSGAGRGGAKSADGWNDREVLWHTTPPFKRLSTVLAKEPVTSTGQSFQDKLRRCSDSELSAKPISEHVSSEFVKIMSRLEEPSILGSRLPPTAPTPAPKARHAAKRNLGPGVCSASKKGRTAEGLLDPSNCSVPLLLDIEDFAPESFPRPGRVLTSPTFEFDDDDPFPGLDEILAGRTPARLLSPAETVADFGPTPSQIAVQEKYTRLLIVDIIASRYHFQSYALPETILHLLDEAKERLFIVYLREDWCQTEVSIGEPI
ncbi:hypothetical protein DFJ73DRAFT_213311 [Zopfochytrium polystomum]|nr:hypothetical protein DFJ73DRAFT_213311 [Zopfochytrium polystomum]